MYSYFDGNNHTISGIYCVSENNYVGLLGYHGYYDVTGIKIANSYFEGVDHLGAIAGYTEGGIRNCAIMADVTVKGENGKNERVGLSLTGYYLETDYIPNMEKIETGDWWKIWSNTKTAIFANYMNGAFGERETTYVKDDFHFFGNMKTDPIPVPEVDDYFTIWTD